MKKKNIFTIISLALALASLAIITAQMQPARGAESKVFTIPIVQVAMHMVGWQHTDTTVSPIAFNQIGFFTYIEGIEPDKLFSGMPDPFEPYKQARFTFKTSQAHVPPQFVWWGINSSPNPVSVLQHAPFDLNIYYDPEPTGLRDIANPDSFASGEHIATLKVKTGQSVYVDTYGTSPADVVRVNLSIELDQESIKPFSLEGKNYDGLGTLGNLPLGGGIINILASEELYNWGSGRLTQMWSGSLFNIDSLTWEEEKAK